MNEKPSNDPPDASRRADTAARSRAGRTARPVRFTIGPQEFVKTGLSWFDPRDPYYFAVSLSWRNFVLLFLAVELAINMLFALLYSLQPGAIANQPTAGFVAAFFFSLETLATVGYGEMYPATLYGHVVSAIEIVTGVMFTAIMTGLLFVRFSKPKAKILYAANPVVTRYNGRPTLMLRVGNARQSPLLDAHPRLYALVRTVSVEGHRVANVIELPLVRDRLPVFAIMWTMMHVIDEASPLLDFPEGHVDLPQLRLFVTVEAHDPAIGQNVWDLHNFTGADVRFGMRYVDAVQADGDSVVVADFRLLGAIEADMASADPD